jgi:hypothetical protein
MRRLTGLSKLQSLVINAPGAQWEEYDHNAAAMNLSGCFPGSLTSLTELRLQIECVHDINSVSQCVHLHDLQLRAAEYYTQPLEPGLWGAREWDSVAQLTGLTRMRIDAGLHQYNGAFRDADAFHDVIRKLKGLREVGAGSWTEKSLPVLQSLTSVTAVWGGWVVGEGVNLGAPELVCPHITLVGESFRDIPFAVFPNLTSVSFQHVSAAALSTISQFCTGLQRLALDTFVDDPYMAMLTGSEAACVSAMRSLAHLQHLTHLELSMANDAELLAFTSEAAAVGTLPQLRYLRVQGTCSMFALLQLQSMRGVVELVVDVQDSSAIHYSFSADAVRAWLVGLAVVPNVSLLLHAEKQQILVEAARQWATALGLPLPACLRVSHVVDRGLELQRL